MGFILQGASSNPQYYAGSISYDTATTDPLNGTVNDLTVPNSATVSAITLNCSGDVTLNGLAGGTANRSLTLINSSTKTVTIAKQASGSQAKNQFASSGTIAPGSAVSLIYSALLLAWIIGGSASASPSYKTISFVNASAIASGVTTCSPSVPSGVQNGDLMLALCEADGPSANTAANPFTSSGWTQVLAFGQTIDSGQTTVLMRVASSEPSSYTFTSSNATASGGLIVVYRNVDTTTPFNTMTGQYQAAKWTSHSFTLTAVGGYTTIAGCQLIWLGTGDSTVNTTYTAQNVPSGYTSRISGQDTSGWNALTVGDKVLSSSGAFASASAVWTQTGGSNGGFTGIHLALQPATN